MNLRFRHLSFISLLLLLSTLDPGPYTQAATVIGTLQDISIQALDTTLIFTPTNEVLVTGTGLSAGPPIMIDTTGAIVIGTNTATGGAGDNILMPANSEIRWPNNDFQLWGDTNHSFGGKELHILSSQDISINDGYGQQGGRIQFGASGYPGVST